MTEPYSAPPAKDESKLSADDYWAAHPELAAERHKHDRARIAREETRKAESEVERFLQTADSLFEAFRALKPELAQSDKGLKFGSTRVIDFGERNQNRRTFQRNCATTSDARSHDLAASNTKTGW